MLEVFGAAWEAMGYFGPSGRVLFLISLRGFFATNP